MKIVNSLLVVAAIVLGGCAASGPKMSEMKAGIAPIPADSGRVYFYRSSSMFGAALQPDIRLNGKVVGSSKPGGFFYADIPAGNATVTTATEVEKQLTFTIGPKETKYVKTSPSFGVLVGRIVPELIPTADAEKDLVDLSYAPLTK